MSRVLCDSIKMQVWLKYKGRKRDPGLFSMLTSAFVLNVFQPFHLRNTRTGETAMLCKHSWVWVVYFYNKSRKRQ